MREHDVTEQVKNMPDDELRDTRRDLAAGIGLMRPGSPMYRPATTYLNAIDTELAQRRGAGQASSPGGSWSTGRQPPGLAGHDPEREADGEDLAPEPEHLQVQRIAGLVVAAPGHQLNRGQEPHLTARPPASCDCRGLPEAPWNRTGLRLVL
jgi:hypothetical protein